MKRVSFKPQQADRPPFVALKKELIEENLSNLGYGLAAATSLLFYLSPATGEPVAFHANNRLTQIRSLTLSSIVTNLDLSDSFEVNFVESLLDDTPNVVDSSGSNPMHYFATAVTDRNNYPATDAELKQQKDTLLQTWMSINYHEKKYGNPSVPKQLVIANQGVRDVTTRDINELHYLLNIPQYHREAVALKGAEQEELPVVFSITYSNSFQSCRSTMQRICMNSSWEMMVLVSLSSIKIESN